MGFYCSAFHRHRPAYAHALAFNPLPNTANRSHVFFSPQSSGLAPSPYPFIVAPKFTAVGQGLAPGHFLNRWNLLVFSACRLGSLWLVLRYFGLLGLFRWFPAGSWFSELNSSGKVLPPRDHYGMNVTFCKGFGRRFLTPIFDQF